MEEMIKTSNADAAPLENVEMPVENAGVDVTTGQEENLFPLGGGESITNMEGLPTGHAVPVDTSEQPLQEQEPVQTEEPVKTDPGRMEYWQSQADKAKNDSFQLQQEQQKR